ncbi:selenium metabolism-associated LysR family transcriptional regulator [Bacillus sp. T33-2]|uniref:selenium metabolism-associated LysR family transcriptional regulator n=1 Tax=Bacillus sp. T33-2 TaxID=2054168 RepID=UPI000C794F76|nr:selenium metabolism-associated LysR family transcriptional regulator [Bacillus sp. T33-2]PLR94471.1 LysR family transcriptional regulator [Bacillus sp. T33-2]
MNLKKLEAFIFVVEKKSFSEAAAKLKCSQPAISLQIKSLEEDLGLELLDRSLSGIQPTPAGISVYQAAKEMIKRWNRLAEELHGFHDNLTGTLTIGASTIPGTYIVPHWMRQFRRLYPKVEVKVEIGDSKEILAKLLDHQIDVGFIGLQPDSEKIKHYPVASDSLVLIAPDGHPLANADHLDFSEVKQYEFVLREEGSGTRKVMDDYLSLHGVRLSELHTVASVGSTEALIASVEAGLGISCVSKLAANHAVKAGRIKIIDKFEPFQRTFYFTSLKGTEKRPIVKEFAELIEASKQD